MSISTSLSLAKNLLVYANTYYVLRSQSSWEVVDKVFVAAQGIRRSIFFNTYHLLKISLPTLILDLTFLPAIQKWSILFMLIRSQSGWEVVDKVFVTASKR